jgi:hypothetical protein
MHYINLLPLFKNNPIDTVRVRDKSRVTFVTRNKSMEIHMKMEIAKENLKNLSLVLNIIGKDAKNLSYIDLSFRKKIIVKYKKTKKT